MSLLGKMVKTLVLLCSPLNKVTTQKRFSFTFFVALIKRTKQKNKFRGGEGEERLHDR